METSLRKIRTRISREIKEEGYTASEIEKRITEQDHIFSEGEFGVQTQTKRVRIILTPGYFENFQAKNVVKVIYDSWESTYRPKLEKLLGVKIQSHIWGDLSYIRHSITHRSSKGIEKLANAKLIRDFKPGEEVILTSNVMEKIRRELDAWYTEFLMKYFSR